MSHSRSRGVPQPLQAPRELQKGFFNSNTLAPYVLWLCVLVTPWLPVAVRCDLEHPELIACISALTSGKVGMWQALPCGLGQGWSHSQPCCLLPHAFLASTT
jgi:hypothetical protein